LAVAAEPARARTEVLEAAAQQKHLPTTTRHSTASEHPARAATAVKAGTVCLKGLAVVGVELAVSEKPRQPAEGVTEVAEAPALYLAHRLFMHLVAVAVALLLELVGLALVTDEPGLSRQHLVRLIAVAVAAVDTLLRLAAPAAPAS
jgi:hypothetical protein